MRQVYLVTGSPGSGKSHYCKEHAGANDVIFDLDEINVALGGKKHEDNSSRLGMALAMREAAIMEISNRSGKWQNAYFISASWNRDEIEDLCRILGAKEIAMKTSLEQCKINILNDETREDKVAQIKLAELWHDKSNSASQHVRDPKLAAYKQLAANLFKNSCDV